MKVRLATEEEWENIYSDCPYSTFYHSKIWYKHWANILNAKLSPLLFIHNERSFLLPLLKFRHHLIFTKFRASPLGTYGFLLSKDIIDAEILNEVTSLLKKQNTYINITGNPYNGLNQKNSEIFTQIIYLDKTIEELESKIKKKQVLLEVKKAIGHGLQLKRIPSIDLPRLFEMYTKRRKEWKNPTNNYSYHTFEHFYSVNNADFWGVYLEDKLIGGGIFFVHKSRVFYWFGISDSDYFHLFPNKFLIYKLIHFYHQKNITVFDLNPSGGHQGVVNFKNSFGAVPVYFNNYEIIPKKSDLVKSIFRTFR